MLVRCLVLARAVAGRSLVEVAHQLSPGTSNSPAHAGQAKLGIDVERLGSGATSSRAATLAASSSRSLVDSSAGAWPWVSRSAASGTVTSGPLARAGARRRSRPRAVPPCPRPGSGRCRPWWPARRAFLDDAARPWACTTDRLLLGQRAFRPLERGVEPAIPEAPHLAAQGTDRTMPRVGGQRPAPHRVLL
jgi:hypothetical protein